MLHHQYDRLGRLHAILVEATSSILVAKFGLRQLTAEMLHDHYTAGNKVSRERPAKGLFKV